MNPVKGETPLRLSDGRQFKLVLDQAALMEAAYAYTGKPKVQKLLADLVPERDENGELVLDEDGDPIKDTIPATRALLFGAMQAFHPEVTLRDAMNMIVEETEPVGAALHEAMTLNFPDMTGAEDREDKNPPPTRPRSKRSGRSGAKSD